ncbi:ABC transporter substrate-binding protein [Naumannella cuiyingiana]|uniref:Raffinose/stachyose/melibiose transport system substrate-binding protein n=1 Tax=Naumannella cuiyingiana TaxID=1347891 RepID=A0A7Z0D928_9ACTN|nr:extracellular solute-binding protein [Naumannella cuiyingiana]NYI71070.1 raffinose/stachyose/melibiose transport system substrate-binding protein [Naumannella cuiyingiana]
MKLKRIRFSLPLAMAGVLLAACSSGPVGGPPASEGPDPNTWRDNISGSIEVGVIPAEGTPGLAYLEKLAREIEADYPGTKITLTFANSEARPALEQRWRSGDGPDVDYGMFDGTVPSQRVWANDGFLLDLKPYLDAPDPTTGKTWGESFTPAASGFMVNPDNGGVYGVPSELSTQVLFYNKKIFAESGIKPPTTWDELMKASADLKAAGVDPIAITGLYQPYMGMWSDNLWLREVGWTTANDVLVNGKGRITDDPGFLRGLQKVQDLRDGGYLMSGFQGTDFTAAQAQFFQGKTGMILMGSWLVSEMKDVIPDDFEIGVLPFPEVAGGAGDQKAIMAAPQQMSINAKSENIPLALEWVRRVTSPEVQAERAEKFGELSGVVGVPSPSGVTGIDTVMADASALVPREFAMKDTEAYDVVYAEVTRLMFGEQDATQTLARLDEQLRKIHKN